MNNTRISDSYYDEESVANMLYEMDKQQLRYLLSVIEGLLTSHQTNK